MRGELFFESGSESVDLTSPRRGTFTRRTEDGIEILDGVCRDGTEYVTLIPTGEETEIPVRTLADQISGFAGRLGANSPRSLLVAGLGNASVEADSLGPLTADRIIVGETRRGASVFALKPGVREQTGIRPSDLVRAAVALTGAELVAVVDSLAAAAPDRIGRAVQVAGAVRPGSGTRRGAEPLEVQVPLISLGVPTAALGTLSQNGGQSEGLFTLCGIGTDVVRLASLIAGALNIFAAE